MTSYPKHLSFFRLLGFLSRMLCTWKHPQWS